MIHETNYGSPKRESSLILNQCSKENARRECLVLNASNSMCLRTKRILSQMNIFKITASCHNIIFIYNKI